jgi:hypothetical protein
MADLGAIASDTRDTFSGPVSVVSGEAHATPSVICVHVGLTLPVPPVVANGSGAGSASITRVAASATIKKVSP